MKKCCNNIWHSTSVGCNKRCLEAHIDTHKNTCVFIVEKFLEMYAKNKKEFYLKMSIKLRPLSLCFLDKILVMGDDRFNTWLT